jgi:hypothetical protein
MVGGVRRRTGERGEGGEEAVFTNLFNSSDHIRRDTLCLLAFFPSFFFSFVPFCFISHSTDTHLPDSHSWHNHTVFVGASYHNYHIGIWLACE